MVTELVDWSGMKYRIENIPPGEMVVDRFRDLQQNSSSFMDGAYGKRPEGIPDVYDVDDWILRYILLMDSPGTPAELMPDMMERKVWALKTLGVTNPSDEIKDIVFFRDKIFNVRRVLFLRLQYNGYYRLAKQLEAELYSLEVSGNKKDAEGNVVQMTEQESATRQTRMKTLMANIDECNSKLLRGDSNKDME